jgi:hypothetical protein
MVTKQWIQAGLLTVLMVVGGSAVVDAFEPKKFEQKVAMTQDHISSVRGWATTYANLTTSKDFTGINMASIGAKGIMQLPIVGTGATSTVVAPFDKEMSFAVTPVTGNKKFTITITQSASTSMDATQMQMFEDLINNWVVGIGGATSGYQSSSADGDIAIIFAG